MPTPSCFSAALSFVALLCGSAQAAVFVVNVVDQDLPDANVGSAGCDVFVGVAGDQCTLRAAVMEANATPGPDTIVLPANETITLTIPESDGGNTAAVGNLNITTPVSILGVFPGASTVNMPEIVAANNTRIFLVADTGALEITGVALVDGTRPFPGGAIILGMGTSLIADYVSFRNNSSGDSGGAGGGAIRLNNGSSAVISNSDFFSNTSTLPGTAISVGTAELIVSNSSFRQVQGGPDSVAIFGGTGADILIENTLIDGTPPLIGSGQSSGIEVSNAASLVIRNSTLVNFTQNALRINNGALTALRIYNSILDSDDTACDLLGPLNNALLGYSYVGDTSCNAIHDVGMIVSGPLLLGPLETEPDSVVRSRSPAFGSVAIDAGLPFFSIPSDPNQPCLTTDQRGIGRPLDGDADGEARCDLGAVETSALSSSTYTVNEFQIDNADHTPGDNICDSNPLIPGSQCTLRAAVMEANAKPGPDTIDFQRESLSEVIQISLTVLGGGGAANGDLEITEQVLINDSSFSAAPRTQIMPSAEFGQRIFDIDVPIGQVVTISGIELGGGNDGGNGGALRAVGNGSLILNRMVFQNNTSGASGGAISSSIPTIIRRSHFEDNQAAILAAAVHSTTSLSIEQSSFFDHGNPSAPYTLFANGELLEVYASTFGRGVTAVRANTETLRIERATIHDNQDDGLQMNVSGFVRLTGNIVSGSGSDDCLVISPPVLSIFDANLIEDGSCPHPSHITASPNLAPETRTYGNGRAWMPLAGSPVIDALPLSGASGAVCTLGRLDQGSLPGAQDTDQDGDIACELGALELSPGGHLPLRFIVNQTIQESADPNPGDGICGTIVGGCNLRAAVMEANAIPGYNEIGFSLFERFVELTNSESDPPGVPTAATDDLDIFDELLIYGNSAANPNSSITIQASHGDRIFDIINTGSTSGQGVELRNLELTGGLTSSFGGAVRVGSSAGSVVFRRLAISNSSADQGGGALSVSSAATDVLLEDSDLFQNSTGGGNGAAIHVAGQLTVRNSSIHDNIDIGSDREAVYVGGGSNSLLLIGNSTLHSNVGAGITVEDGSLSAENLTITSNDGNGIRFIPADSDDAVSIRQSILSGNADFACLLAAPGLGSVNLTTDRYNLVQGPQNCNLDAGATNLMDVDPLLGNLQTDQDSISWYRIPGPGSPAIDNGHPTVGGIGCSEFDQLGMPRPVDGDGNGSARCDIGAIEVNSQTDSLFMDRFEDTSP